VSRIGRRLLGEGTAEHEGGNPVSGGEAAVGRRLANHPGHLQPRDERQGRLQLVQATGDQHVGEAHAGGVHLDQRRAIVVAAGSRYLLEDDAVGPREVPQQKGAHDSDATHPGQ
jgi:hypothetical protein